MNKVLETLRNAMPTEIVVEGHLVLDFTRESDFVYVVNLNTETKVNYLYQEEYKLSFVFNGIEFGAPCKAEHSYNKIKLTINPWLAYYSSGYKNIDFSPDFPNIFKGRSPLPEGFSYICNIPMASCGEVDI
jgi:hypothetical protein